MMKCWSILLCFFSLLFSAANERQRIQPTEIRLMMQEVEWRVLPVRSQAEYKQGKIGGEGYQHLHGIARCRSHPEIIYLSQDCAQVWRSDDAGESWKKVLGEHLYVKRGQSIEVDPVNPDLVFAILENHSNPSVQLAQNLVGLYRSKNGGLSWDFVLPSPTIIYRMYQHNITYDLVNVSSTGATRWYAAFPGKFLYRSEDRGDTWEAVADLSDFDPVYTIQTHPSDGRTVYVASQLGLYSSSQKGANLQKLGNIPQGDVSSIAVNEQNPQIIYAVLKDKGLYSSKNGGVFFSLLKKFDAQTVCIHPGFSDTINLIGTHSNMIISHDAGQSWIQNSRVIPAEGLNREWKTSISGALAGIVANPENPNEAVAYAHAALWKTNDGGNTFYDSSTLFTGYAWSWWNDGIGFDAANPNRFCFFCCDVGMIITENGGDYFKKESVPSNWLDKKIINWTGMHAGDIQPIPGSDIIVASVGEYFHTKLARKTTDHSEWKIVDLHDDNNLFIAFHPQKPNLVYAGNKRSFDAGESFHQIHYLVERDAEILGMCRTHPDIVYAMTTPRNTILRSDDCGDTWRVYVQVDWYFNRLDSKPTFAVDPENPDNVYTLDKNGDLAVYDGTSWNSLGVLSSSGGLEWGNFVSTVAIDPRYAHIIYAGTYFAGLPHLWRSTDGGKTWNNISGNCPRMGASALAVHPLTGDLMQGTVFGTWILPPPYENPNSLYEKCIDHPVAVKVKTEYSRTTH